MRYKFGALPAEWDSGAVALEFKRVQATLDALIDGQLEILHNEPVRPRDGMVVFADGTDWNPGGGGAGVYARVSGAWIKL